jgi:hypothetical protein
MAGIGAVVAPVDAVLWPTGFGISNSLSTCGMRAQADLVSRQRYVQASRGGVMHLVITVGLGVFVDDEVRKSAPPEIAGICKASRGTQKADRDGSQRPVIDHATNVQG